MGSTLNLDGGNTEKVEGKITEKPNDKTKEKHVMTMLEMEKIKGAGELLEKMR